MKAFAEVFETLDATTKTTLKINALSAYFEAVPEDDRLWTIALFSGRRPKRAVTTTLLRQWAAERAGIAPWLFEECYPIVGDLAETISLVLPPPGQTSERRLSAWLADLETLPSLPEDDRKAYVLNAWNSLDGTQRFLFNKLITGGFRVGVSQKLMTRALARATQLDEAELAHRLMGNWTPSSTSYRALLHSDDPVASLSRPYPFYLAHALDRTADELGAPSDWHADWKWDGIRGQIILRGRAHFVWSRGEELMTDRFPEFAQLIDFLPQGTVLDGEILVWRDGAPQPFAQLQKRIGRKHVPAKLLAEAPVRLYAYDLLEWNGKDIRAKAFSERRKMLTDALADVPEHAPITLSPDIAFDSWQALEKSRNTARAENAEGVMLKRKDSPYLAGR